jgi:MFS family permease
MQAVLLVLLARALGFGDAGYGWLIAGLGVGGVLGTALSGRAARSRHPRRVLVLALVGYGIPAALMAVTPCLTGLLVWAVASGASGSVIEVLSETGLQRALDEDGFAAAYGIAFSTSIGGLAGGSLVAAPLVALFGLAGAIVATGALVVAYVAVLLLPERSVGRHRAMARPAPVAACLRHPAPRDPLRVARCVVVTTSRGAWPRSARGPTSRSSPRAGPPASRGAWPG